MLTVIIIQKDNPILRQQARPVPVSEITSPKIKGILSQMGETLHQEEDGVAIAAPQIGQNLRIFVIAGKVRSPNYPDLKESEIILPNLVFINPEIIKLSKRKKKMVEGCLSIRWLYGEVLRSTKATVEAYDETGKQFRRGASGILAQIFQHEVDHLNGILFIDTAENVENIPPEPKKNNRHE